MKTSEYRLLSNTIRLLLMAMFVFALTVGTGQTARAAASPAPVDLGMAAPFVILTKTGISNVPTSAIVGDIGTSPIDSTGITGFSLVADATNEFSTSSQVTGKVYAADYAPPTPSNMTTAISNMEAAYTDAAGRPIPDFTELYAGDLSGQTLAPGLYKWGTGVLISTNVTLSGPSDAVWIFQIAGDMTMESGAQVMLTGGAQASNIFWQVGGGTGVEIGTTAHVEGTILAAKAIHLRTGASLNGRALAQTAVTLDQNTVVISELTTPPPPPATTFSDVPATYWAYSYIERLYNAGVTGGCSTSPLNFCPDATVTRAQMAIFILRGMNGGSYVPPAATGTVFADVPLGSFADAWIEQLALEGVTSGCGSGNYCPDNSVSRAEMAIFLLRGEHGSAYAPPAASGTVFTDVPLGSFADAWIEQLALEAVTTGCGGGNYCPGNSVTRAEMAVFLVRAFSLP